MNITNLTSRELGETIKRGRPGSLLSRQAILELVRRNLALKQELEGLGVKPNKRIHQSVSNIADMSSNEVYVKEILETNSTSLFQVVRKLVFLYQKPILTSIFSIGTVGFLDAMFVYLNVQLIDLAVIPQDINALTRLGAIYAVGWLMLAILVGIYMYAASRLNFSLQYVMNKLTHAKVNNSQLDPKSLDYIPASIKSGSYAISELLTWVVSDLVWTTVNIITCLIILFTFGWAIGIFATIIVITGLSIIALIHKRWERYYRATSDFQGIISEMFGDMLQGVRLNKSLNLQGENSQEFRSISGELLKSSLYTARLNSLFMPVAEFIFSLLFIGFVLSLNFDISSTFQISVGNLVGLVLYPVLLGGSVITLARNLPRSQQLWSMSYKVLHFFEKDYYTEMPATTLLDLENAKHPIILEKVSVYDEDYGDLIRELYLQINHGEKLAIIDTSEYSKSALCDLFLRFRKPYYGDIKYGTSDYYAVGVQATTPFVAIATTYLFDSTVQENIRFGRLDATDSEIEAAAKKLALHELIMSLEDGYNTVVDSTFAKKYAETAFAINLVRAFLSNPLILLVDDPLVSTGRKIDTSLEHAIQSVSLHQTSIVFTRRVNTLKKMDRILILDNGQIVEMGTHAELLRMKGFYTGFFSKQFRKLLQDTEIHSDDWIQLA